MASDAARGRLGVWLCVVVAVVFVAMGSRAHAEIANFAIHPEPKTLPEVAFQDGEGKNGRSIPNCPTAPRKSKRNA